MHPTQLYEVSGLFILFLAMHFIRKKKAFEGMLFIIYWVGYGILRSFIELYRGDKIRGFIIDEKISTSQFISILTSLAAIGFCIYLYKRKHRTA